MGLLGWDCDWEAHLDFSPCHGTLSCVASRMALGLSLRWGGDGTCGFCDVRTCDG